MKFSIIVARYDEDVEWTKEFSNVIIYNKGEPLSQDYNQIFLNNCGREGHTYYKHIYDNYDDYNDPNNSIDYIIFLQGEPFDHSPNLLYNIDKYINDKDLDIDFEFLSEKILTCKLSGCIHHKKLPLAEIYKKIFGEINRDTEKDFEFVFGSGAQFIVSKKKILQKPKNYYLNIVKILENEVDPIEGYVIERLHKLIFLNS